MSKKYLVVGIILLVVVLGVVGGYLVFSKSLLKQPETNINSLSLLNLGEASPQFNDPLANYTDLSGYSFSYPETLTVKDVTPNDDTYYSAVELTKGGETIKIDIKTGNIDPYKTNRDAKNIGSVTLAGISMNQYEVDGRLVSVAIDQGVVYVIDGPKDSGFFEDSQDKIISSFKFAGQASTSTSGGSDNTTYEEEVVE